MMITDNSQLSENAFEMDFDQPAINIGSHPDNDIVLKGDGVLPFHVSLVMQDGECQILPLDADADVRLDGKPVQTAQFKLAGAARRLDVGANKLLLEHNKTFDSLHVRIHPAGASSGQPEIKDVVQATSSGVDSAILLNLFSQTDEVEVGQTASYELEIVNAGALVASFTVFIDGVPKEWVTISPEEINLYEGQHKRVQINITPPRHPGSTAGQHELNVSVFSPNYPGQQAVTPIVLRIKPYYEFTLGNLSPREQSVHHFPSRRRMASTSLPVTNMGNAPADFSISSTDDENACSFDFVMADELRLNRQAALHIDAGETLLQPIEITPRKRRWINGKRYSHTTAVQVTNQAVAPQMVSGSLNSHPFISLWLIIGTILTMAIIAFIILQPGINYFRADKAIVEPKDNTVKLGWSLVPFTDRVTISANTQPLNNGQPLINGQTSFTVTPIETTTYEIVAGNWLSGIFRNLDRRETVTVLVVPPSPTINDFSVDNSMVAPGKLVNISWSVTQADQVTLTVGDSVEVLKELKGERIVPMKADTLVALEAQNAGGEALRSHFVHVKQPEIIVNRFVVLVHPKTAVQNGTAKGAALSQQSDSDNWTEYVELVPDATSDDGYRAAFVEDYELDKGEPVMVEWDVTGADNDKVKVTTDTLDELPSKSSKPAFPEKSMNYVLTATSGELVKIFTLPVKVFNGSPPTAPTIEFFQAVPMAILGKGDVKFSWSVAGAWTRIALINSEGVVADYVKPQGFKTVTVSQSDTYILTAWNGELSASKPLDITVSPALLKIGLQIESALPYPETDHFWVGDKVAVSVKFDSPLSGKPDPTGSVIVTDGSSSCSFTLPITTCELYFKTAGEKQLTASYGGDTTYVQGKSSYYPTTSKIIVSSPSMILNAQFHLPDSAGNLGNLISLSNQRFEITQKLFAKITFKPSAGRALDDNDTGNQINYSICKLGKCSDQIRADSIVIQSGTGTAIISIPGFPGAGSNYELRFYYNHTEHLFESTSISRSGFTVLKLGIYLTLPPTLDCIRTDGILDGTTCSFGYINPTNAEINFDIRQTVGRGYLDSSMIKPIFDDTVWKFEVDSLRTPCSVKTRTVDTSAHSIYFLSCIVNAANKVTLSANYTYHNITSPDYLMGDGSEFTKSFLLRPTRQIFINFDKGNYEVGTIIPLMTTTGTGKSLHLIDAQTKREITQASGEINFSISNMGNQKNLLGVVKPGSTCNVNSTGNAITGIYVGQPCEIFFRKVGTWDVLINFGGDENNSRSSGAFTGRVVSKQEHITTKWYYSDNPAVNPSVIWDDIALIDATTSSPSMTGRIVFSGPGTFSANALDGAKVSLTRDTNPSCRFDLPLATASKTIEIIINQQGMADFGVTCPNTPAKSNLNITLLDENFAFELGNDAPRQVLFYEDKTYGDVFFEFQNEDDTLSDFVFDWNDKNASKKQIEPVLYAGEPYKIHLMYQPVRIDLNNLGVLGCSNKGDNLCSTTQDLLDFIQFGNSNYKPRDINIEIPPSWQGKVKITKQSGICSVDNEKIIVPLIGSRYFDDDENDPLSWHYVELSSPAMKDGSLKTPHTYEFNNTNPCIVTFSYTAGSITKPLGVGEVVKFSFSQDQDFTEPTIKVNNLNIFYSASENYKLIGGLAKFFVIPTFYPPPPNPKTPRIVFNTITTTAPANAPKQNITMTLSKSLTGQNPLDNSLYPWFKVGFPNSCIGGSLVGTVNSIKMEVKWELTKPQSPCTGRLTIDYIENPFFGEKRLVDQPVQFTNPSLPTPTTAP